ncbi:hypothetical protein C0993_011204, partial [Termitomyces sp. T159_Od127]
MAPVQNYGGYTAEVTQVSASHAPVIGRGTVGPKQLDEFEYNCRRYFSHREVEEGKQVERIMYNVDVPEVRAWVRENEKELKELTFSVFMARLRGIVLSTDWAWEVAQTLSTKQGEDERFMGWANNLREANDILVTMPRFHIPAEKLRDHILLHCHDDVRREYGLGNKDECYDNIKDFNQWLRTVANIDSVIAARKSQISKYITNSLAASVKSQLKLASNSGKAGGGVTNTAGKGGGTGAMAVGGRVHVYPLTAEERRILNEHAGCYQCRKLYVEHRAAGCPDRGKTLTLEEYEKRKLTPEFAAAAQLEATRRNRGKINASSGGSVAVAAVFEESSEEESEGGS